MPKFFAMFILLLSAGCSTHLHEYRETTPTLQLENFYNGDLVAYGIVQNYSGKVIRRFKADLNGSWQGSKGKLEETFYYDDGEIQQRTWMLEKINDNQYRGNASDVTEPADGEVSGFAMNWQYTLQIKVDEDLYDVNFNDWMYLIDDQRLINRAEMNKWGFKVGEVTIWIEKVETKPPNFATEAS